MIQNMTVKVKGGGGHPSTDQNVPPASEDDEASTSASASTSDVVPDDDDDRNNGFNVFRNKSSVFKSSLPQRRRRMNDHFEDLSACYFTCRARDMTFPPPSGDDVITDASSAEGARSSSPSVPPDGGPGGGGAEGAKKKEGLENFSSCLSKFTRYSKLHPLATLNYATDIFTTASIVSSIEFDKDKEFFAIAGVTKRIKVRPFFFS